MSKMSEAKQTQKVLTAFFVLAQVSRRHTDVPAIQQGLDQREDLRAAPPPGPAGSQVTRRRRRRRGSRVVCNQFQEVFHVVLFTWGVGFCILMFDVLIKILIEYSFLKWFAVFLCFVTCFCSILPFFCLFNRHLSPCLPLSLGSSQICLCLVSLALLYKAKCFTFFPAPFLFFCICLLYSSLPAADYGEGLLLTVVCLPQGSLTIIWLQTGSVSLFSSCGIMFTSCWTGTKRSMIF